MKLHKYTHQAHPRRQSPTQRAYGASGYSRQPYYGKPGKNKPKQPFPFKLVAAVVGILLIAIGITQCSIGCSDKGNDWSHLYSENGRYYYQENGTITSLTGIDVSSHQQSIDWSAVAQDNIDFAMIRCGNRGYSEGNLFADSLFYQNADGAQSVGLPFGVYFFSQAINEQEAEEEAEYVLQLIQGMEISGPIAFDQEDMPQVDARANNLSPDQLTKNAEAFCNRIEQAGYKTLIYGNQHDLSRYDLDHLDKPIWYAQYSSSQPSTSLPIVMWQYSADGSVSGIQTDVDLNILFDTSLIR